MEYDLLHPWKTLDPWQKEYIETKGNCFMLCSRQAGKTTAVSIKMGKLAVSMKDYTILMIAYTEKQAYNLFFKTLVYLRAVHPTAIKKGIDRPTKHEILLKNGSRIMCYAAGLNGYGLVGYTCNKVVIDEAAPMAQEIYTCIAPMVSVTGGSIEMLSTPKGKQGFFYDCSKRDDFTKFYVSAEECPRHTKEFLENARKYMSKLAYAQEYLAVFLDDLKRVFSAELLKKCMVLKRRRTILKDRDYFLGSDVAGLGEDKTTFEIFDGTHEDAIEQVEHEQAMKMLTTDTSKRIIRYHQQYNLNKIGVDDGGVGYGVWSELMTDNTTKRKTVGLNNASRPIDSKGEKSKKLLKEEMYQHLLVLMENGKIKFLDDDELAESFASVQKEYETSDAGKTTLKIHGSNTHAVEGVMRAVYLIKSKGLNLCAYYHN